MTDLIKQIDAMPSEQRAGALAALDALTRPLTVREIEAFLRKGGVSRSRAVKLAGTLRHWHIIALLGPGEIE